MSRLLMESLGWALLHSLWQGTLVALLLAVALVTVGRRAAHARYALACGALVLALALPVASGWMHFHGAPARVAMDTSAPPTRLRVDAAKPHPEERTAARPAWRLSPVATSPAWIDADMAEDGAASGLESTVLTGLGSFLVMAGLLLRRTLSLVEAHLHWLVLAWAAGVGLSSGRMAAEWMKLRRLADRALPAPHAWQERLDALSRRLGLHRAVRLLQSSDVDVPAAVGWLSPVVLLPVSTLAGLPARQLEMVLAHELAHIRRHDFAVNLAQVLVETLLFFHPAVRWISHVIRVEREHCCDDVAVAASGNSVSYARALTALETLRVLPGTPSPAMSALGGSLPERVRRLITLPTSRCASRWAAGASVLTLVSSLAVAAPLTSLLLGQTDAAPRPGDEPVLVQAPPIPALSLAPPVPPAPTPVTPPAPTAPPAAPASVAAVAARAAPGPIPPPAPPARSLGARAQREFDGQTRVGAGQQLSVAQLIALKNAGITPERVRQLTAMGYTPTVANLVTMSHAGVTPDYVQDMNTRFGRKLEAEELTHLRHLGVTPEYIQSLKSAGFNVDDPKALSHARAVGVDEDFVRGLKDAGYTGMSMKELAHLRAVGVSPEYIRELTKHGLSKLKAQELTRLRAVGVSAGWLASMRKAGVQTTDVKALQRLRATGVDADFLGELHDAGLKDLSVDELVRLRTGGVDADFIRRMRGTGSK
ncbi:M56 family metallopeptidase [Myxococcus sp. AM001]|nr:M56 family metallopeptidase [Myxococcus sp. AM001]